MMKRTIPKLERYKFPIKSICTSFIFDAHRWGLGVHLDLLLYEFELVVGPFRFGIEHWGLLIDLHEWENDV